MLAVVSHAMQHMFSGVGCLARARRNMEVNGSAVKAARALKLRIQKEASVVMWESGRSRRSANKQKKSTNKRGRKRGEVVSIASH